MAIQLRNFASFFLSEKFLSFLLGSLIGGASGLVGVSIAYALLPQIDARSVLVIVWASAFGYGICNLLLSKIDHGAVRLVVPSRKASRAILSNE